MKRHLKARGHTMLRPGVILKDGLRNDQPSTTPANKRSISIRPPQKVCLRIECTTTKRDASFFLSA